MAGFRLEGPSGDQAVVDASGQLSVKLPLATVPADVGGVRLYSENDAGSITGDALLLSPETDQDSRLRIATETLMDMEVFSYTAQNTGKFVYRNTTMTVTWTAGQMTTNGANVTTTTTGVLVNSYAMFPVSGASVTYVEVEVGFTNQPTTNTIIDFGMFLAAATNPFAPTDGVYFRLTSAGIHGVANFSGTENPTPTFSFTYTNNRRYKFLIAIGWREVQFWIDDVLYGVLQTPSGQALACASVALPFAVRHAIAGGAAGVALQALVGSYAISLGGMAFNRTLGETFNAALGSYQGLSGGTMGSLASYANSANPTAAVPTNTTSTVCTALGGQGWETDTLAVNTDGIIMSYLNPAGTAAVQGRRIRVTGVTINSYVQTALTGGGYVAQYALCFGHNALSLATAEAATAKAPRRIALGIQTVASGAAVLTQLAQVSIQLQNPIYVNPGEYLAIAKKKVGTAPSAGVIAHTFTIDYARE
jgi:hypothetical protein